MSSPRRTVAVLGGAFDPPHLGHVVIAATVLSQTDAAEVVVVPSYRHPFAKRMAPYDDRLAMCDSAFSLFGTRVRVSRVEEEIARARTSSFTVDTLDALADAHPGVHLRLVLGADAAAEREKWHAFDRIEASYPPILVARAGFATPADVVALTAPPDISSTEIRRALAAGATAIPGLPRAVRAIAEERDLYGASE